MERFWQDIRHGCRMFVKNPAFTAIAVISIAFGTGANVAIFSATDALLLRPLPVPRPGELMTVGFKVRLAGLATRSVTSYADYVDIRDRSQSFDSLLAFTSRTAGFNMRPGAPPQVKMTTLVSGNFFRALGIVPLLGRDFRPDEDQVPGRDAVTVLSYGMWKQEFAGDPSVLGQKIRIASIDFTVIGVAPESFTGIEPRLIKEAAFVPLAMWPRFPTSADVNPLTDRGYWALTVKGRLRPGVTLQSTQAEISAIGADLARAYPATNKDANLTVETELRMRYERNMLEAVTLMMLTVLSVAVLCVACANVAGLLSSRAPVRAREIALRQAIGAGRGRIVQQLITESLAIAIAGGIGGIVVGYAGVVLLRGYEYPTDVIAVPVMQLDQRALVFSLVLAIASAFLFGLVPALQTTRVDLVSALKSSDAAVPRRLRLTGRNALVALQVALSLVLLTVTAFILQMFRGELTEGPGFRTTQMVKLTVDPGQARYGEARAARFFEQAVESTRRLPGVRHAGVTTAMPLFGSPGYPSIIPEGYPLAEGQTGLATWLSIVDEGYFETMNIPVLAGRNFRVTDGPDVPRVAIVNDTLARRFWPAIGASGAVGKRFRVDVERSQWFEVVGVVKTTKMFYPGESPQGLLYVPFRQDPRTSMVLLAETIGDSASMLGPIRDLLQRLDADVPVYEIQTIEAFYGNRFGTISTIILELVSGIGLMGLILTMVGLYGLVSYAVSRRTREIGIRLAVGAGYWRVLTMVLRQGMTPAFVGLLAGLVLSAVTARLLPVLLPVRYQYDTRWFLIVVPLLFVITLLAAFLPARRAARVDPTIALRCD